MTLDPRDAVVADAAVPEVVAGAGARAGAPVHRASLWRDAWRRYLQNKGAVVAGAIFVFIVLFCLLYPLVSPHDPDQIELTNAREGPTLEHPLGTDAFGRDMLTRVALAGRISLAIGLGATIAILLFGVVYGSTAGFFGGRLDNIQMRLLDALYGLPYLPFAIILLAIIGTINMWTMMLALSIASWFTAARIVRGQIITLKQNDYVRAAQALGARWYRVLTRHLLPNTLGVLIIAMFLELPGVILGEAFLGFIGLGISPPEASLGSMAEEGRAEYRANPHIMIVPSLAIAVVVLCANFIADGMRDALDPRTRETKEG
ncbi:MAG TPA: ABC transporter permease [Gaiellaceae bacterium]|nr:ABC transporter permease [Gaiellaceae bacterium]